MTTRRPPDPASRSRSPQRPPQRRASQAKGQAKRQAKGQAKGNEGRRSAGDAPVSRWLPALAAGGVLVVVIAAGMGGSGGTDASAGVTVLGPNPGEVVDVTLTVPPITQPNVVVESTLVPIQKSVLAAPITIGAYGPEVEALQQRLAELGFAPGPADGSFGEGTQQAVWAFKKMLSGTMTSYLDLARSESATTVTPELWSQMQDPITVQPRRPQGIGSTHVEIYLPLQVMVVFTDDVPTLIAHIATGELDEQGNPMRWCEVVEYDTDNQGRALEEPVVRDECAYSKTPGGVFKVYRRVDGNRLGPLGGMYNPLYFNYGIAIHGAQNVPKAPASHGCIRINMDIAEVFPSLVDNGDRVFVWGHDGKEPENYSKKETLPSFNAPNPDSTTTSSSSTTSSTTTTPTTTAAPVTTTDPATTKPVSTTMPTSTAPPITPPTTGPVITTPPVTTVLAPASP